MIFGYDIIHDVMIWYLYNGINVGTVYVCLNFSFRGTPPPALVNYVTQMALVDVDSKSGARLLTNDIALRRHFWIVYFHYNW